MDEYRKKLLSVVEKSPQWDLKSLSLALGKSHSYLHKHIHTGSPRKLDGDDRRKLAMMLCVSEHDLLQDGETLSDVKEIVVHRNADDEFTNIPVYDVRASAGNGSIIEHENIMYYATFRTDWLRYITNAPFEKLCVIRVDGDSMLPTLANDDTVLVDMTQTHPRKDGIYVIQYDGALMVKRVQIDPVRRIASIISDNEYYAPITDLVPDEINVAGRVIWLGRRV